MSTAASPTSTVFRRTIEAAPKPVAVAPEELRSAFEAGPINILIVDDESKNLTVVEAVLNDPAYRLVRAESADEALLALLTDEFALLILDIRMPGVTGIELAQMIKERKKTSQIPIIFLTAYYNEDQHVLEGYGAGAVDYLHKPVNPEILRSKVAVFAELHRMQREIAATNRVLIHEIAERRQAQDALCALNETLEEQVLERTRALRGTTSLLQAVTDNASVGLLTLDRNWRCQFANPAAGKILSLPPDVVGKHAADVMDRRLIKLMAPSVNVALTGERTVSEIDLSGPSNQSSLRSHYSVACEPEHDQEGQVVGVVIVIFDISERKRNEEHVGLLLSEINHRAKNIMSVVSAIARQTTASNQAEYVQRFLARVHALSASHDVLAKNQWRSISIAELVRAQLAHFEDAVGQRIGVVGPHLYLSVAGAQCIGMVMHELATNATKYGALSNETGRVEIAWALSGASDSQFTISWIERDGPQVVLPKHRGFGSTVIKGMVELQLNGKVELHFKRDGLNWRLCCPAKKIVEHGAGRPAHSAQPNER